jgi:hypothetical protein
LLVAEERNALFGTGRKLPDRQTPRFGAKAHGSASPTATTMQLG